MTPPVFIVGCPRSGTTYLAVLLNNHPKVFLTKETRVMTWVSSILSQSEKNTWAPMLHRKEFHAHVKSEMRGLIERFYRKLGVKDGVRWGDQFAHYADGKNDPRCLPLIKSIFPGSQFIHIIRDPRAVVASIVARRWANVQAATEVWLHHVNHGRNFGRQAGAGRYTEIRYEDLVTAEWKEAGRLLKFIRLGMHQHVSDFITREHRQRTPVSSPVAAPGRTGKAGWAGLLSPQDANSVQAKCKGLMAQLGYK